MCSYTKCYNIDSNVPWKFSDGDKGFRFLKVTVFMFAWCDKVQRFHHAPFIDRDGLFKMLFRVYSVAFSPLYGPVSCERNVAICKFLFCF